MEMINAVEDASTNYPDLDHCTLYTSITLCSIHMHKYYAPIKNIKNNSKVFMLKNIFEKYMLKFVRMK